MPLAGGAPRKRVLFVDDEAAILEGLRAVLRPQRREWDMVFALGGPAGLAELEASTFDVVVTDMRMPVLDGAQLLGHVKQLQPRAVRLVLSGQTDAQTALKSVFAAHQFLAKPCDPEKLRNVVKRCCDLYQLLETDELRSLAADVTVLPAAPTTYMAISKALADPHCGINDVARIVEREPTLCAKVLQIANSAFFGLPRAVNNVSQAATYLGTLALRDLALAMETMASVERAKASLPLSAYREFQLNALAVGLLARRWFAGDARKADEAFIAGMLRDMGHLVIAARARSGVARRDDEQHAALSAYLLGLWGIPHGVLEAVAFHEQPQLIEHDTLEVVDVVHLADRIMQDIAPSPFQAPAPLDSARLARLGVSEARLKDLTESAQRLRDEAREMLSL
jgi:HD-like signal output (HDOD) protein